MRFVHVLPLNDLVEHEMNWNLCICSPSVEVMEESDGNSVVTHHSLDGREFTTNDHDWEVIEEELTVA